MDKWAEVGAEVGKDNLMALSAEERHTLIGQLPDFEARPELQFLADRKLLPQQRGIESFENPPFLTQLRRAMFGLTQHEQRLTKNQDEALVPFQQEQEIQAKLRAVQNFAMRQPLGPMMQAFPGALQPEESQMRTRLEPLIAQTMQPPNVGQFSEAGPNNPVGRLLQGPPQLIPTNAAPEEDSSRQFAYQFPTQPIRELDPQATITEGQVPLVQQLLAGHLVSPQQSLVPPSLQASRESPVEVNPGNTLVSRQGTPLFTAPGKPDKENEELKKFRGVLAAAGIDEQSPEGQTLFKSWANKIATQPPGTNVTTNVNTEKKFGEIFSSKVAEQDTALLDAAQKAPDLAERSNRILQVLGSGKVLTGTGAEFRLQAAKAFKLAGLSTGDGIEETETLSADLASNTLDAIKASGLGSGTGFSNADREFLEKAKGGKITLEAGSLKRLAILSHRAAQKTAERWGTRVKSIPKSALEGTGISTQPIAVTPVYVGDDAGWAALPKGTQFVGPDGKVRVK